MAANTIVDTTTLHAAVRSFTGQLNSVPYRDQDVKAITTSALLLMRQLPVARNAVLSYFGRRFDDAANRYLQYRVDKITGNLYNNPGYNEQAAYESLSPISVGFSDLISDQSWAPQLSKWAIDLLGHISKKLNSSNAAPLTTSSNTVEEKLELWMACSATKILIEITSHCFSIVVEQPSAVDSCVDSLLDASIKYAPHFDWVVAHLGSCFPKTIIDRVLIAGYKDFISPSAQGSTKFSSAAAILGYLSAQHKTTARKCITTYFQNVLNQPPPGAATAVTFLLNTASLSAMMVPIITSDISSILNIHTLNKLTAHYAAGVHDFQSLMHIAVHLLLRLEQSSLSVINVILDLASGSMSSECDHQPLREEVKSAAHVILGKLTNEILKTTVCSRANTRVRTELPTLKYLILGYKSLTRRLHISKSNEEEARLVSRLLLACAWQGGITTAVEIIHELMTLHRPWVLKTIDDFIQQLSVRYPDLEENLCHRIFAYSKIEATVLSNLQSYIGTKTESSEKVASCIAKKHMKSLAGIIESNEDEQHFACLSLYAELVNSYCGKHLANMPSCDILLSWYFECISMGYNKQAGMLEQSVIASCGQSVSVLSLTLRKIITLVIEKAAMKVEDDDMEVSLSDINSKLLGRLHLPATKTYILHNEIIGKGKKTERRHWGQDLHCKHRHRLVQFLIRCCEVKPGIFNATDAKELLSRIMLEVIAPDVIAAKTLWHDPITHERELAIRRMTDQFPFLWDIIGYICTYKPCFVTVSLIVRCHLATLCTSWGKALDGPARRMPKEIEATEKVISFLVRADLLPRPLIYISELFPHLACYEIKLLLDIVFKYVQSSLLKGLSQDPLEHDDLKTIQSIIQKNIGSVSEVSLKFLLIE